MRERERACKQAKETMNKNTWYYLEIILIIKKKNENQVNIIMLFFLRVKFKKKHSCFFIEFN